LFSSSVQDIRETLQDGYIPVPAVRRILRHLLLGIARLHKCGVAHTGVFHRFRLRGRFMLCLLIRRFKAGQYHD
jgi:hypothetical protein